MDRPSSPLSAGRISGSVATVLGAGAGLFLLFGPAIRYETVSTDGSRETGTVAGIDYLLGVDHAVPALLYWSLFVIGVSLVGGFAVWTDRRALVAVAAVLLGGFAMLGIMTIGLFAAPAAVLFVVAGILMGTSDRNGQGT